MMIDDKFLSNLKNDEHLRTFGMSNIAYAKELSKSNSIEWSDDLTVSLLVFRYQSILLSNMSNIDGSILNPIPLENDETNDLHLLWMLQELIDNVDQSVTKKHRWLGYIQGVLIMKGYTSVSIERNETRDILNGS